MLSFIRAVLMPAPYLEIPVKSSPDEIIAAAIVESFAKDFDDWRFIAKSDDPYASVYPSDTPGWPKEESTAPPLCHVTLNRYLCNDAKEIKIFWHDRGYREKEGRENFYVNRTQLENSAGRVMVNAFKRLKDAHESAKAAAAKAKADMERNEAAWNLAERLLGKKRMPNGALVPATSFCESCVRHDGEPSLDAVMHVVYKCPACQKKEVVCSPSTGSNGSVPIMATEGPTRKVSTKSLTRSTKQPALIRRAALEENCSPLLTPL